MRKVLAVPVELACGLPLVVAGLLGVRVLLQSRSLVYLFLPWLCLVAVAIGFWRGRAGRLASWGIASLLNLPLLPVVLWFISRRAWPLLALPVLGTAFTGLGAAMAASGGVASRRRLVILPLIVILNLVLVPFTPRYAASLIVSKEVSEAAVPFRISPIDGGEVAALQLRGRVVILDFWATWCGPCRRELPELERLYELYEGHTEVAFYAIDGGATDTPGSQGDTPEQAREFFRKGGYRIPLAHDADGSLGRSLSVSGFPTLLVLDRFGRVRLRHVGFIGSEDLVGKITALIQRLGAERYPPGSAQMLGVDRFGGLTDHRDLFVRVVQDQVRQLRVPDVRFRAREEEVIVAEAGGAEDHFVDAVVDRLGPPLLLPPAGRPEKQVQ